MLFLAKDAQSVQHSGLHGRFKEIFIDELLTPYLDSTMRICTGIAINSDGRQSNQIDIIIYDSDIIPPALLKREAGVIPAESVLATIEIKSKLNARALKQSISNGDSVKELSLHQSVTKDGDLNSTPSYVFAFSSDLKDIKKTEKERILELIESNPSKRDAPISGVCVSGKSFIYWIDDDPKQDDKWNHIDSDGDHAEILHFITTLIDYCYQIKQQRKRISIQHYVF